LLLWLTDLTGEPGQRVVALLHPQEHVSENAGAVVHQLVIVIEKLGSEKVG